MFLRLADANESFLINMDHVNYIITTKENLQTVVFNDGTSIAVVDFLTDLKSRVVNLD